MNCAICGPSSEECQAFELARPHLDVRRIGVEATIQVQDRRLRLVRIPLLMDAQHHEEPVAPGQPPHRGEPKTRVVVREPDDTDVREALVGDDEHVRGVRVLDARRVPGLVRREARQHHPEPLHGLPLNGLVPQKAGQRRVRRTTDGLVHRMPVEVSDAPIGIDQLDPLGVAMQDIAVAVVPLEAYGSEPDGVALDRGPLPLEGLGLVAVAIGDGPALEGLAGLGVNLVGDAGVVAEGDQQPVVEHQLRKLHGPVPSRCGGTQLELLVPRQHESLLLHSAIDPENPALLEVGAPDELLWVSGHEVQICDHTETVLRLDVA
mmetsp:Transcript_110969/g.353545  ORF Transcript_110969/g.353545 Transcript_110969/m.353545 type:complete len:320 (+) Transcript_110969:73-1032(+)